jgi:hypothetical protein
MLKSFSDTHKKGFDKWFSFLLISTGAVFVNYLAFKELSKIEKTDYSIAYPISITIAMFIMRGLNEFILTPSNRFLSTEEKSSKMSAFPEREYKKVVEDDSDKIAIYPRITIRDVEIENAWRNEIKERGISGMSENTKDLYYSKHIIFDSSDFIVINKTFGAFENLQECFAVGQEFKFKEAKLITEKVQVDFMSIYDDYSGGLISKHTNVYEGKDTPYHIQIIVWARRIGKN